MDGAADGRGGAKKKGHKRGLSSLQNSNLMRRVEAPQEDNGL